MSLFATAAVYAAVPALVWSLLVLLVQGIGIFKIFRGYSSPPPQPVSPSLSEDELPHITIIRPVKGLEPQLYECLASTFRQTYPKSKLTCNLCVSSEDDPAYPILDQIVNDFGSDHNIHLLVEEYDPLLSRLEGKTGSELGPNPKIRNISRAYREAPSSSLIWVIDCNVWVSKGVAGRMVDKLLGFESDGTRVMPYKLVHQLPLVVDIPLASESSELECEGLLSRVWRIGGGRLDEMFMATTHAKFYSAINTVGIAPCIIGKSNMFRREHLDMYTDPRNNPNLKSFDANRGRGVDFFSSYMCEDHLLSELLWNAPIPEFKNHGLVWGDLALQPVAGVSVSQYWARRVRWLRVRKWTVLLATLVEPGVESLLCNAYFSFAITTLSYFHKTFNIPQTWLAMAAIWTIGVIVWMLGDYAVHYCLHSGHSVEVDVDTPFFARGAGRPGAIERKPLAEWLPAWIGRELLALPIWTWAVLLGTTVVWRGKVFWVRRDMSVIALEEENRRGQSGLDDAQSHFFTEYQQGHQDIPERSMVRHRKSRPCGME